ncbi:hypothetical protein [Stackebrandtia nassauensis]|nr:hypothetical protein [Stackebrandtia nassauensis]
MTTTPTGRGRLGGFNSRAATNRRTVAPKVSASRSTSAASSGENGLLPRARNRISPPHEIPLLVSRIRISLPIPALVISRNRTRCRGSGKPAVSTDTRPGSVNELANGYDTPSRASARSSRRMAVM